MLKLEAKEILIDLIKIPSFVDETHDERGVIEYIENFIKENTGYKYVIQQVEGERKNILVYNKPNPKIALFGHMDTVLPKIETVDPFEPKEVEGRLYGLGSVDMKSGLAVMLKIMSEIQSDELSFVFSVDEEYDFKGALKLKEITDFKPEFIVNVEPTDLKILNGCRGITEFSFKVMGKSAHAGRKEMGINTIEKAVEITNRLQDKVGELDIDGGGKSSVNLAYLNGGMLKEKENGESKVVGMGNVVPNYTEVICEIRIANPEITRDFVEKEILKFASDLGVAIGDLKFKFYLGSMLTKKNDLVEFEEAIKSTGLAIEYSDVSLAGYYEVQMLQEVWGSKCVVFGAGPASLSHMVDEYVEISYLDKTERCLKEFILKKVSL